MIQAMKRMMALLLAIVMVLLASPFAVLAEGELIEETLTEVTPEEILTEVVPEETVPAAPVTNFSNAVSAASLLAAGEKAAEPTYLEQIAALQAEAEALDPESETLQDDCADIYARLMVAYEAAVAEREAGTITEEEYNEIYNATGAVIGILYGYGYDPYAVVTGASSSGTITYNSGNAITVNFIDENGNRVELDSTKTSYNITSTNSPVKMSDIAAYFLDGNTAYEYKESLADSKNGADFDYIFRYRSSYGYSTSWRYNSNGGTSTRNEFDSNPIVIYMVFASTGIQDIAVSVSNGTSTTVALANANEYFYEFITPLPEGLTFTPTETGIDITADFYAAAGVYEGTYTDGTDTKNISITVTREPLVDIFVSVSKGGSATATLANATKYRLETSALPEGLTVEPTETGIDITADDSVAAGTYLVPYTDGIETKTISIAVASPLWEEIGIGWPTVLAIRGNGTIPGEPSIYGASGYMFINSTYTGYRWDSADNGYRIAANSEDVIKSSIVDHANFDDDDPKAMGVTLASGANLKELVYGNIDFEKALITAATGTRYTGSGAKTGTLYVSGTADANGNPIALATIYNELLAANGNDATAAKQALIDTYELFPYVVKYEYYAANNRMWHIDCAIRPKANVTLSYNLNVPSGYSYSSLLSGKNIGVPNSQSDRPGTTFSIGKIDNLNSSLQMKVTSITDSSWTATFTFQGWNTEPDGSGTWYYPSELSIGTPKEIKIYEDTVLYAIWDSNPAIDTGIMKLEKIVATQNGDPIDATKEFTFTLTIPTTTVKQVGTNGSQTTTEVETTASYRVYNSNNNYAGVSGTLSSANNGSASNPNVITLKHGQYALIDNLPDAKVVSVVEASAANYTTSWVQGNNSGSTQNASVTIVGGRTSNLTYTNTMAVMKTSIIATKVWEDSDNAYNSRPASISLQLWANGVESGAEVTLPDANGNWTYTWSDLPINDASGKAIIYTVTEDEVLGYTSAVTGDAATGFTVTNKLSSYKLTVKKTVSGNMGDQSKKFAFVTSIAGQDNNAQLHHNEIVEYTVPYGAAVKVTETPEGYTYSLDSATYKDAAKNDVALTNIKEEEYGVSFTMPAADVTVVINNANTADIDTGILLDSLPYVLILAVVGAALVLWFIRKRRVED